MKIKYKGKDINVDVRRAGLFGLMLKSRETGSLLFEFGRDTRAGITSWFVFFDFLALWLDSKDRVVEWEIIKPWRFLIKPSVRFRKLVEIPLNSRNERVIGVFRR